MKKEYLLFTVLLTIYLFSFSTAYCLPDSPERINIFPLQQQHVHGSTIAECPNGDLIAAWFQGSGERWADDVRIMGSRLKNGTSAWSEPFLMADVPGFPDINPVLFIDQKKELWLAWYTVIANQWETSLLKFRKSRNYMSGEGSPEWYWQDDILVKPGDLAERGIQEGDRFVESVENQLGALDGKYLIKEGRTADERGNKLRENWIRRKETLLHKSRGLDMVRDGRIYNLDGTYTEQPLGYPYFRRMGWQTLNKPFLQGERIILPLYSDGFSFSLMAITDNQGISWSFSEPLVENGNIQPAIAARTDGTLVAFMRDNGPEPKRLHVSESADRGETWSIVENSTIPNPGSGADIVTLANGHWLLIFNDTENGRHSLAVSLSTDGGQNWSGTASLEFDGRAENPARSHYPAIIQGKEGRIHAVYSYHLSEGSEDQRKTIRYASFTEEWVRKAGGKITGGL